MATPMVVKLDQPESVAVVEIVHVVVVDVDHLRVVVETDGGWAEGVLHSEAF